MGDDGGGPEAVVSASGDVGAVAKVRLHAMTTAALNGGDGTGSGGGASGSGGGATGTPRTPTVEELLVDAE